MIVCIKITCFQQQHIHHTHARTHARKRTYTRAHTHTHTHTHTHLLLLPSCLEQPQLSQLLPRRNLSFAHILHRLVVKQIHGNGVRACKHLVCPSEQPFAQQDTRLVRRHWWILLKVHLVWKLIVFQLTIWEGESLSLISELCFNLHHHTAFCC